MERPEIRAHTQEVIVSVHVACLDLDVPVSDQNHEECQNSGVLTIMVHSSFLQSSFLQSLSDFAHEGQYTTISFLPA